MILFYRKSYFNFLLKQFHMTEKRKPLSKESGHLTVQVMEYSSCFSPYKYTGPLWGHLSFYLPSFYYSLVYLITENIYQCSGSKTLKSKRSGTLLKAFLEHSDLQALPWTFILGFKIFWPLKQHVCLQLTSLLLLCSWHKMDPLPLENWTI